MQHVISDVLLPCTGKKRFKWVDPMICGGDIYRAYSTLYSFLDVTLNDRLLHHGSNISFN